MSLRQRIHQLEEVTSNARRTRDDDGAAIAAVLSADPVAADIFGRLSARMDVLGIPRHGPQTMDLILADAQASRLANNLARRLATGAGDAA